MPRRRSSSSERRTSRSASSAAPDIFDDYWLSRIRERSDARYIDLTKYEDRRRWHPSKLGPWTQQALPKGIRFRPRIVIVPEGHKLARLQTYGGRYSLRGLQQGWKFRRRSVPHDWMRMRPDEWPTGAVTGYRRGDDLSRRVGFQLPWQVIICVRRKRRREVMHALNIAGRKGVGAGRPQRRDEYSDVRC